MPFDSISYRTSLDVHSRALLYLTRPIFGRPNRRTFLRRHHLNERGNVSAAVNSPFQLYTAHSDSVSRGGTSHLPMQTILPLNEQFIVLLLLFDCWVIDTYHYVALHSHFLQLRGANCKATAESRGHSPETLFESHLCTQFFNCIMSIDLDGNPTPTI